MKRAPAPGNDAAVAPRVRRGYFESRFGQLHVHIAMPAGGGFDEATALLCLHSQDASARMFRGFLEIMGRDRSAYAPDAPGFGDSDPPHHPTIADCAAGIADFLDSMRFRKIDLLGCHLGAAIAAELAVAKPQQVRRVVMIGIPLLGDAERGAVARPSAAPAEDGSHPTLEWCRALALYPMRERLAAIAQPVLMLRPKDDLWEATLRAREVLPRARLVELPEYGSGLLEGAPQVVADAAREFLR